MNNFYFLQFITNLFLHFRENVKQLFECFCEIAQPNGEKQPWILQRYPESYNDSEILKSVPKFAYPCEIEKLVFWTKKKFFLQNLY